MGLLPIIFSTLSIFTALVVVTLLVSFIIYKIKSPKKKPYLESQLVIPAAAPVYIQKVSYEEVRKEPVVYHQINVRKAKPQLSRNVNRFQVLNSQQMNIPTGFSYYR